MTADHESHREQVEPPELVPARMLNEFAYCPRLAYLEWVQGDFEDNADTVDGRFHHRRVDVETGALPEPDELEGARFHARSIFKRFASSWSKRLRVRLRPPGRSLAAS